MVKNKNLAYVVSNFPCYSETFILNELVELKRRGYRIFIFSLRKPKEKIIQKEAQELLADTVYCPILLKSDLIKAQFDFLFKKPKIYLGILFDIFSRCIRKPSVLFKSLGIFPKTVYFAFYARDKGVSHIHAHFANYPATSAFMISRLLDTPFSFTCHAHDIFYDTTMLDLKIINAKACFAISEYNRRHISKLFPHLPKEKLQLLHCGIDPGRFPFLERGKIATKLRILSVGRLMPTKGFDDLIRSCKILKDKGIDFICDIVGDGPMEAGLRQLLEDLDLKIQVNLRGPLPQEDIIRLYQEADIFVLASRKTRHRDVQDGIPVVLMEAMASGIPVISTRISGIPELIEDTVTGILVCPEDLIGLSKAIERIYFDTEYAGRLARNARARVEKEYDISISADKLIATISPPYA